MATTKGKLSTDEIRELAREHSPDEMARMFGIAESTIYTWLREAGLSFGAGRMNHKRFLPWELTRADSYDGIASALRAWSKQDQGASLNARERNLVRDLMKHVTKHSRVVKYDRRVGFTLVPRVPEIDDPDLPIRRPPVA